MSNRRDQDDNLAYGDYHGQGQGDAQDGDRGFIGDMGRRFFGNKNPHQGEQVCSLLVVEQ